MFSCYLSDDWGTPPYETPCNRLKLKNFDIKNNFGTKKNFGQKKCLGQKLFGVKKNWDQNKYRSKYFGKKNS